MQLAFINVFGFIVKLKSKLVINTYQFLQLFQKNFYYKDIQHCLNLLQHIQNLVKHFKFFENVKFLPNIKLFGFSIINFCISDINLK